MLWSALAGVLVWSGFPGLRLWWLGPWVGVVPLLFVLPVLSTRRAALAAWVAGTVCCGLTLLWLLGLIPIAGTIAVLGYGLLVPLLGGFWIVSALVIRWFQRRWSPWMVLALPSAWAAGEWLQNQLFTGFGWVLLGYTQGPNLPVLQVASVGGVYAVSWVIALVNTLLWRALATRGGPRARAVYAGLAVATVGGVTAWGANRASATHEPETAIRFGIVQGAFATEVKWDRRYARVMWEQQVVQSEEAVAAGADVVVWSESALGLAPFQNFEGRLRELSAQLGRPLVLGANYHYDRGDWRTDPFTNAVLTIYSDGRVEGPYDKQHLTPFGEYTPLQWLLPWLNKMIPAISDFTPGTKARAFEIAGITAQPLVCFESVFPAEVRDLVRATQADLLLHVTNVGWFGHTIMPEQDLIVARVRAIELGIPMVRAANVGISCAIDPLGRFEAIAGEPDFRVFVVDTLVADVGVYRVPTLYARFGDAFVLLCALVLLAGGALCYTRAPRPSN